MFQTGRFPSLHKPGACYLLDQRLALSPRPRSERANRRTKTRILATATPSDASAASAKQHSRLDHKSTASATSAVLTLLLNLGVLQVPTELGRIAATHQQAHTACFPSHSLTTGQNHQLRPKDADRSGNLPASSTAPPARHLGLLNLNPFLKRKVLLSSKHAKPVMGKHQAQA